MRGDKIRALIASTSWSAPSDLFGSTSCPTSTAWPTSAATLMHTARMGRHRRPDGQAGRGDRHRRQRRAGGPRTRGARRPADGLPAHAAVDGAQGRPPLQRRGTGAFPSRSWAVAARTVADVEVQHDNTAVAADDPLAGRPRRDVAKAFLRRTRRRRGAAGALTPRLSRSAASGCCSATSYYQALQREHVELVSDPIDRITDDVGRDRGRRASSTSTRSCWPRDSRPATTCPGSTSSASAGRACTTVG